MKVRLGEVERTGRALDLRDDPIDPERLVRAARDPTAALVAAPPPGPVHEAVGFLRPEMDLDCGSALVAAGRSIGLESPYAAEIDRLDREIAAIDPPTPDLRAARKRVAEAGEDLAALEEDVARISGRLNARRDAGLATEAVEDELAARTRDLTEAETEVIAAREALSRAEERAAAARDARAKRLSLVDRRENRRREARQWFRRKLGPTFELALRSLPLSADPAPPVEYSGADFEAALALARIGSLAAPVVLVGGPFETAVAARAALASPVILASV
jgi:hypothetical protein